MFVWLRLQCWCGDDDYDQYGTSTGCTMACTGDSDELCGGRLAMSVYENEQLAPTAFVGCFADKRSDRIMTQKRTSADMTAEVRVLVRPKYPECSGGASRAVSSTSFRP